MGKIMGVSKNYLCKLREAFALRANDSKMKDLAYFALIISLTFAALFVAKSLDGHVSKKWAENEDPNEIFRKVDLTKPTFEIVLLTYQNHYKPKLNLKNLQEYALSEDFHRHAKTAHIYYNSAQISHEDALRIIFQREPTNIAMGNNQYNEHKLEELFGYRKGIYNDKSAKKSDGTSFKDLPNTATVYSETYLWNPPGGNQKKEIACLSLPAPALDSKEQPHYSYYVKEDHLDSGKYETEMQFLFSVIEKAIRDNKETAFQNKGIKRVVLSRFGQGAFLAALSSKDQDLAHQAYKNQMANFLNNVKDLGLKIVMSEYSYPEQDVWYNAMIVGDIIETAEEYDLIINAWDPHSAPGNGNDADASFDGSMGKGSAILLTQTSWLNTHLRSKNSLAKVQR